jgi:hypothetical protein
MEIKYTTDGKKVVVIGNLNSQDKIVQEIFIVNGQEIPSGENFIAGSLHDAPAISWKEKNLKELEDNYEAKKVKYKNDLDRLNTEYNKQSALLKRKLDYTGEVLKNVSPDSFTDFVDMLTGNIKWVVTAGYTPELLTWEQFYTLYDDKLRLISIFGRDNGTFTYARGTYSDYSGGSEKFMPFNNYDKAFEYFKEQLLKKDVTDEILKLADKHNIELPADKIQEYKTKRTAVLNANIEKYKQDIVKWEAAIIDLNQPL